MQHFPKEWYWELIREGASIPVTLSHVQTMARTPDYDLIEKQGFADAINRKMRSYWIMVSPKSKDYCPRRGEDTQRGQLCNSEVEMLDTAASQGEAGIIRSSLRASGGVRPC